MPTLIAGETDSFKIEIILDTTKSIHGSKLYWDGEFAAPVIAWLSVPVTSGITFVDKGIPDRSGHQTLLKFDVPEGNIHFIKVYKLQGRCWCSNREILYSNGYCDGTGDR